MKLKYLSFIACILLVLAGCTKDATVWERTKVNEVKLLSFGFYKADNPALLKDYILEKVSAVNVSMLLPTSVDKSNLVARFTAGENDVIKVGGVIQKSGESANDFTAPVDYILSDGNNNAKYTVTVAKGSDYIWTSIPFTFDDSATSLKMKVNPVTSEPYILFYTNRTPSDNSRLNLLAFEGSKWNDKGIVSDGRTGIYDFTFNSSGVPFVGYMDYTTSPAQKYTVKTLSGGSWSLVGGVSGITPVKITHNAIAFDAENRLQGFSMLDAASGEFTRRDMSVSTFNNGAWSIGKITTRPSGVTSWLPTPVLKGNALYLGIYNSVSPNSFSVYKWANDSWATLLEQYIHGSQTQGNIYDLDLDVDDDGNVYIATVDNSDGGVAKLHVLKYNQATRAVTTVGNYISAAVGSDASFDLALSPVGVPYLLYRTANQYPTIISFDEETQDWTAPQVLANEAAADLMLSFTSNGEAYASYTRSKKIFVHKYTLP